MAPSSTKAKPQSGAADKKATTDSGRHGSSRDYPVSSSIATRLDFYLTSDSLLGMTDEATEETETDAVRVLQDIEAHDHLVATAR
jgi:hypothetical protein